MGVTSLILSIASVCVCWLPKVGWLGVAMGVAACGLGVPSITHWFERPGHTGWGVAGIMLGAPSAAVGIAYQIKHAAGTLDALYYKLPVETGYWICGILVVVIVVGLVVARLKSKAVGTVIASLAIAALIVSSTWWLTTADRSLVARFGDSSQTRDLMR